MSLFTIPASALQVPLLPGIEFVECSCDDNFAAAAMLAEFLQVDPKEVLTQLEEVETLFSLEDLYAQMGA